MPVDDDAVAFLAARSGGDARAALNALELACETAARAGAGERRVTVADAEDAMQRKAVLYDKDGDQHFDFISAWIKSTRGSDPDASLYYLAAMLEGGEDPRYIARRMIVLASEDVGNADPQALPLAIAAAHAVEHVGFPECQFALAQAAIYLSLAPKSNAAKRAILARPRAHRRGGLGGGARTRCARRPSRPRAAPGAASATRTRTTSPATSTTRSTCRRAARICASTRPTTAEAALRERLAELRRARGARALSALYDRIGRSYVATPRGGPAHRGGDPRRARRRPHRAQRRRGERVLRAARPRRHRRRALRGHARAAPAGRGALHRRACRGAAVRRRRRSTRRWPCSPTTTGRTGSAGCASCAGSAAARSCSSGIRRSRARSG